MHDIRSTLKGERRSLLANKKSGKGGQQEASLTALRIKREETRRSNQRREDRHINVVDQAVMKFQRRSYDVSVLNVSGRGAMIESDLQPTIGARVTLRFEECNETQCVVRWVRQGRIGVEFDKETLIIAPRNVRELIVSGRRDGEQQARLAVRPEREPRQHLILTGELHWHLGSMPVRLRNISSEGAMLDATEDLAAYVPVVLEIPGIAAIQATVRWCRSRQIGIRFDSRFDLTALARPEAEKISPDMLKPDYLKSETDPNSPWAARQQKLTPDQL